MTIPRWFLKTLILSFSWTYDRDFWTSFLWIPWTKLRKYRATKPYPKSTMILALTEFGAGSRFKARVRKLSQFFSNMSSNIVRRSRFLLWNSAGTWFWCIRANFSWALQLLFGECVNWVRPSSSQESSCGKGFNFCGIWNFSSTHDNLFLARRFGLLWQSAMRCFMRSSLKLAHEPWIA